MGDKSFITQSPFHEKFLSTITRPYFKSDKPLLAPPLTSNYQLVGIAFDYLLRFYLERIIVGSKTSDWAADEGVILSIRLKKPTYEIAKSYLATARERYHSYIQDGLLTDELISAAICLAHLEGTRRSGIYNEANLKTFDDRDVADLKELISIAQEQDFTSRKA